MKLYTKLRIYCTFVCRRVNYDFFYSLIFCNVHTIYEKLYFYYTCIIIVRCVFKLLLRIKCKSKFPETCILAGIVFYVFFLDHFDYSCVVNFAEIFFSSKVCKVFCG